MKIVLVWWVLSNSGAVTEPVQWEGWETLEECKTALESFSEPNMETQNWRYGIVGFCKEIPQGAVVSWGE